jgi:cell division protein FtsB
MKPIIFALITLLGVLQYQLWFAPGGIVPTVRLQHAIEQQAAVNKKLIARNDEITADIQDLKTGNEAVEEHGRNDLGMIKHGEVFYQIVKTSN